MTTATITAPPTLEALLERVEALKKSGGVDLSTEEDLSIAIMNLISLEEHFFFTGAKTDKPEYFDLLGEVRSSLGNEAANDLIEEFDLELQYNIAPTEPEGSGD